MNATRRRMWIAAGLLLLAGCQDWNRKSSPPTDLSQPPEKVREKLAAESPDLPGIVEDMHRSRKAYLEQLTRLEKLYLEMGDVSRANWARRQRERTENIEVYPYLGEDPPEASPKVSPQERNPKADAMFDEAKGRLDSVRGVPMAGFLNGNREKARQALLLFKELIRKYPTSDKVDDAAFYIAEIYKEYLRKEDPDDELSIKYYQWAVELDPKTPHAARFQCAAVEDFRRHNRKRALELYREVLEHETLNMSNLRFAASRIEQLTDEEGSHLRPREVREPRRGSLRDEPAASALPARERSDDMPPPEPPGDRPADDKAHDDDRPSETTPSGPEIEYLDSPPAGSARPDERP